MGLGDFWLQFNNGKKEQLGDTKNGIRKEQVDKKYHNLFDAYDTNQSEVLENSELERIFKTLSVYAGNDKILDNIENQLITSIFSVNTNVDNIDFQSFVKSVSKASADIIESKETLLEDGGKEILTTYKDGTKETIGYYPNGDFKYKKTEKLLTETHYFIEINGEKKEVNKQDYELALKRMEEIKAQQNSHNIEDSFKPNLPFFMPEVKVHTNTEEIPDIQYNFSSRSYLDIQARDFLLTHFIETHFGTQEALDSMGILDDIGAAINTGAGELWNACVYIYKKHFGNGTEEDYKNFYELVKKFEPQYDQAILMKPQTEAMQRSPELYFRDFETNYENKTGNKYNLQEVMQFQQLAEQYQVASVLSMRMDCLKKALNEVRMYQSTQDALTYNPAQSEGMNPAQHLLNAQEYLLQYFDNDKDAADLILNGTIGNADKTLEAINSLLSDTELQLKDTLNKKEITLTEENDELKIDADSIGSYANFEKLKAEYQNSYKAMYGTDFVPDELTDKVMSAKATGGFVKIAAITIVSILITKSPVMANIMRASAGAVVDGASANFIRGLVSKYGQTVVQQGIKFAMSTGTLATDVGLTLLNQVTDNREGINGEEVWETTKGAAKYIYFGAFVGSPIAQAVTQKVGKLGIAGKLFVNGTKTTQGAITTTTITGEQLVQNFMKASQSMVAKGAGFATDIAAFTLLDITTEDIAPGEALTSQAEMLTGLRIMHKAFEYMLGGRTHTAIQKANWEAAIEKSGVKNWNIKEIKTPTADGKGFKVVYDVDFNGIPIGKMHDANTLITAMMGKVSETYHAMETEHIEERSNTESSKEITERINTKNKTGLLVKLNNQEFNYSEDAIIDRIEAEKIMKDSGFSKETITNSLSRLQNEEGSFNKNILEIASQIKKTGIDEKYIISFVRDLSFNNGEMKLPTNEQINKILESIETLKQKNADDVAIIRIMYALKNDSGEFDSNLLNVATLEKIHIFYEKTKNNRYISNSPKNLRHAITLITDNTGYLNDFNIKIAEEILNRCPMQIGIMKYLKDENGVCYKSSDKIIDYAAVKSKTLDPRELHFKIKFLIGKNGHFDSKNETILDNAIKKLEQNDMSFEMLDYLLKNENYLDFNELNSQVENLININKKLNNELKYFHYKMPNDSPEDRLEALNILSELTDNGRYVPYIMDAIRNKTLSLKQLKLLQKSYDYHGKNSLTLLHSSTIDCCESINIIFEKLKEVPPSVLNRTEKLRILRNINSANKDVALALCLDKNLGFPIEKVADFLQEVNSKNVQFINIILSTPSLFNKLKELLPQISENLSMENIIESLEISFITSENKNNNNNIETDVYIKNFQKLNEKNISKSILYKYISESSNYTAEDIAAITDKIIDFKQQIKFDPEILVDKVNGGSINEILDSFFAIHNLKNIENYDRQCIMAQIKNSSNKIELKNVILFKNILENSSNEKVDTNKLIEILKNTTENNSIVETFCSKTNLLNSDFEGKLEILNILNKDNSELIETLILNQKYNFTKDQILDLNKVINNETVDIFFDILKYCENKNIDINTLLNFTKKNQKNLKLLNHPIVKDLALKNINKETSICQSLSSEDFIEIHSGKKSLVLKIENENEAEIIFEENITTKPGFIESELKTKDGSKIIENYNGLPGITTSGYLRTIYDPSGKIVSRTLTKPSKTNPGVLVVIKEIYNQNGELVEVKDLGNIKMYGSKKQGRRIDREFSSADGTLIKQTIIEGPAGKASRVEINGKVFERKLRKLDNNTNKTTVNNNTYITKYYADKIEVNLTKKDGQSETVVLDNTQLDFNLLPLLKDLPGDYLYILAKTETKVKIDPSISKNAYFSQTKGERTIAIAQDLTSDTFTFAHEFGHLLDYIVLDKLNSDPTLKRVFQDELNAYKMSAGKFNELEIAYFVSKDHTNSDGCLTEVIAETQAIISGMVHNSDFLLLRAKILQENFPKTLRYIASQLETAIFDMKKLPDFIETKQNLKFDEADIDKTVNSFIEHYSQVAPNFEKSIDKMGFASLGKTSNRVKSDYSLKDKIKNYIQKHPNATYLDIWYEVRDCFGARTIIKSGNYKNHPEVKALIENNNMEGAIRRAAELQSEPLVTQLKQFIDLNYAGENNLKIARITNYVSEDGIPYLSESQLSELKQYAIKKGVEIDICEKIDPSDPHYKDIDWGKYKPTSKAQSSGYTALQINFVDKNGNIMEWQFRGDLTDRFAESEHPQYDLKTNKDIIGPHEELKPIYDKFKNLTLEENMTTDVYKIYNEYLTAYYKHMRLLELGFESTPPKLSDYSKKCGFNFDVHLKAENLIELHNIVEDLKRGAITQEEAMLRYDNLK